MESGQPGQGWQRRFTDVPTLTGAAASRAEAGRVPRQERASVGKGGHSQVCPTRERGKGAQATHVPPVTQAKRLLTGQVTELGPREGRKLTWSPSQLAANGKTLSAETLKG